MRLRRLVCLCFGLLVSAQAQWRLQQANTTADLSSISAIDGHTAWAAGDEGTVLRTVDGGSVWQHCPVPTGADHLTFRAIQSFDAQTALVMSGGKGDLSRLYKTTDACKTWELVLTNPDPDGVWQTMQFRWIPAKPPQRGYFSSGVLLGHPVQGEFPLFTSKDYGSTWRSLQEDETYSPGPSATAHPGEDLLALGGAALTTVTDDNTFAFVTGGEGGGRLVYPQGRSYEFNRVSSSYSFSDLHLSLPSSATAGGLALAAHRTATGNVDMMVVGGDTKNPNTGFAVLVHRAGLKRFFAPTAVAVTSPHGLRTAIAFDEFAKQWIAIGPNGTDVSQDDGRTWVALTPARADESAANWSAMSLPFVVGPGGRIGKLQPLTSTAPLKAPSMETATAARTASQALGASAAGPLAAE